MYGAPNHIQNYDFYGARFENNTEGALIERHSQGSDEMWGCRFVNCLESAITFRNCSVNTEVTKGQFTDNKIGIRLEQTEKIKITSCEFTSDLQGTNTLLDNPTGISSFESFSQISNNNRFLDIALGIVSEGTFSLNGGSFIGNINSTANTFNNNNNIPIYLRGNDHPMGVTATNNVMNPTAGAYNAYGILIDNINTYNLSNNTLRNSLWGIQSSNSGARRNNIFCNSFEESAISDNYFIGSNDRTIFINNIYLPFTYSDQENHCGPNGIGATNVPPLNDPQVPDTLVILPPDGYGPIAGCHQCIIDAINAAAAMIIQNGGDNPYTYIEEAEANYNVAGTEDFYALMAYGLTEAISNDDFNFARSILQPFMAYEWQLKLFGIYILEGDYNGARVYNGNLPRNTTEEHNYYQINDINVNRHLALPIKYTMTSIEDQTLYNIAISDRPSAGFAASLHRYLTESSFNDIKDSQSTPRQIKPELLSRIHVDLFPNPIDGNILNIDIKQENVITKISLYDTYGRMVNPLENPTYPYQINVENINLGVYYIDILFNSGMHKSSTIIKI